MMCVKCPTEGCNGAVLETKGLYSTVETVRYEER